MFRFQVLRALFNFAVKKKKLLKVSPCVDLSPEDVAASITRHPPIKVSRADRERIVKAAYEKSADLGAIMEFLYRTGWRPVMACRLTFGDVELETGEITVTRSITKKGREERITKVTPAALAILQKRAALARLDGCGDEDAFRRHLVFWRPGKPASPGWLAHRFGRIVATLRIRGQGGKVPTLYCLRKGFAQDMEAAGATAYAKQAAMCDMSGGSMIDQSTRDTMAAMGHSDPNMAPRHYLDGREALDVVLKKLPGGKAN